MDHLQYEEMLDPTRMLKLMEIEDHARQLLDNPSRVVNGVITIPVVVHVVYNTTAENISDAQVQSQITVLNADFRRLNADASSTPSMFASVAADAEVQFCLASVDPSGNPTTGITRTSTTRTSFSSNDYVKFNSTGGKDAWPAGSYLNLWVCDLSSTLLGYAQFPGGSAATDGVVIDYAYFGTIGTATPPFHLGRTATHEVGHWLNLRHIWGDGGCSVDDFVSDTPLAGAANYTASPCTFPGPNSCNSGTGDQPDMFQNYMDYSDDACMNLFTQGQKTRMRALFDTGGARVSLLSSNGCGTVSPPTCSDGIQNGDEAGVDCGGSSCPACVCSNASPVTVSITFDNYPEETSWTIKNSSNVTVASGGTYGSQPDGSTINIQVSLSAGNYTFTINDAYGDGICCAYGSGSYTVRDANNTVLASGGAFGTSASTAFCIAGGGSTPTCSDGIQNGDETGVDCGGSSCPPCNTGCTYSTINSSNFESGFGIWTDGGTDCARVSSTTYASSGSYSIRLRDNTTSSLMSTGNLSLSAYQELKVDFSFITVSFDNANEDLWLQISTNGGSTYTTVKDLNYGTDFTNGQRVNMSVVITGTFTNTTRLRFRADASADDDQVYIDDVVISGCSGGARTTPFTPGLTLEGETVKTGSASLAVFPNPTRDELTAVFVLPEASPVQLLVADITGRVVEQRQLNAEAGRQEARIDASTLVPGVYFIHLVTNGEQLTKKFVVAR
ncbi:MAG: T9SS type A sorting domain-containing protein [Lewinellaceae bacterium]|nr:T9SS type A sorting domain-containing protein [Lewinellaceae bacterium]